MGEFAIDASGLEFKEINERLKELVLNGAKKIILYNVCGQRYIGTNLPYPVEIHIYGTPGNDLGAFMDGPRIYVYGNAQDGCGNTMNSGEIVIYGYAGDILAMSARGGRIFVRDDVGYRAGVHLKEYEGKRPEVVIGGRAQDFLGEYMAGGVIVLLGLNLPDGVHTTNFLGTGMHGGVIYLRGRIEGWRLGKEVGVCEPDEKDWNKIKELVNQYAIYFDLNPEPILKENFIKLYPKHLRPYGRLYSY